jgi:TM2 domain-containing membrane protein YozV
MTCAVCPYCRYPVEEPESRAIVCTGCGTPHHSDCYAENGGCTVFGCSAAPEEEPKLSLSNADLKTAGPTPGVLTQSIPASRPAPPPPVHGAVTAAPAVAPQCNAGSVLFRPAPVVPSGLATAHSHVDFTPHPDAKQKSTFIILGILLGFLGAHSFYAGYRRKAFVQLGISVLTVGFACPMTWVWAIIDVLTIEVDSKGVKFRS